MALLSGKSRRKAFFRRGWDRSDPLLVKLLPKALKAALSGKIQVFLLLTVGPREIEHLTSAVDSVVLCVHESPL